MKVKTPAAASTTTNISTPNARGRAATPAYVARGEKMTPAIRAGRLPDPDAVGDSDTRVRATIASRSCNEAPPQTDEWRRTFVTRFAAASAAAAKPRLHG